MLINFIVNGAGNLGSNNVDVCVIGFEGIRFGEVTNLSKVGTLPTCKQSFSSLKLSTCASPVKKVLWGFDPGLSHPRGRTCL